jgi:acetoin utilization deacetylase AcuC-like enzyme
VEPVALFYHRESLEHDTGPHPERVARIRAITEVLNEEGLTRASPFREPPPATLEQVTRIHRTGYVASVERLARQGGGALDVDTVLSSGSYRAALRAAGGAVAATTAVLRGEARRAFSLARPPGHHARPAMAMGFCLFNNVAVAAREAQATLGVGRVAIVDLDVHHGNGTQESFYDDGTVLFVSTHQYPFYPGSGGINEIGEAGGRGATLNIPLPAGCGDAEYQAALNRVIVPKLERFRPELLLLSLGFDAHWADPLAMMQLSIGGYVAMVERLASLADAFCQGHLALVLEGGYNLEALAYGVLAVGRGLRGEPWADPIGPAPTRPPVANVDRILDLTRELHGL